MKRRRPSSCSQGEVAFPATCNLKPLDVTDLRSSWPKWHQQFQIYMTAHFDQSTDDHKRLAIFLNFLGPGALGIVNSLFPELINFESSSALKVSFEKKVLPTFANHCLSREPQENFKQTVKLLNTVLEYDCEEPLLLYRELQEVWNSTGITCCRDRMLRNRFVQQIEDDDILAEIQEMKSPSSKEVLERYLEIERDRKCWPLILPYVSTADNIHLSLVSERFSRIVHKYFNEGGELVLDDQFVERYPLADLREWYTKICGAAANVTLRRLSEEQVDALFVLLNSVTELKMVQIEFLLPFPINIVGLEKLTLVDCTMEQDHLEELFPKQYHLLELYLENLEFQWVIGQRFGYPLAIRIASLETLVLKGDSVNVCGRIENLRHLEIVARHFNWGSLDWGTELETIYYDGPPHEFYEVESLKSLTVREWNGLKGVYSDDSSEYSESSLYFGGRYDDDSDWDEEPKQRHKKEELNKSAKITILDPVDLQLKEEMMELSTRCRLTYTLRLEPVAKENLIFDSLNNDCLEKIVSYLSTKDFKSFALTHRRIQELFRKNCFSVVKLTSSEGFEKLHSKLQLERANKRIPVIKALHFVGTVRRNLKIPAKDITRLAVRIRELKLENSKTAKGKVWAQYLQKVNPTLRALDWRPADDEDLLQLQHIQRLKIDPSLNGDYLLRFLEQNRQTLQEVDIMEVGYNQENIEKFKNILQLLATLPNLQHLKFRKTKESSFRVPPEVRREVLTGQKWIGLKRLTAEVEPGFGEAINGEKYPQLQELTIVSQREIQHSDLNSLCTLQELRTLRIECIYLRKIFSQDDLLALLSYLPNLTYLGMSTFTGSVRFGRELKELIARERPHLRIN